jgi:hypothetical protein
VPVACPYCARTIAIQDAKPGRFRMNCPACGRAFALKVGDGPELLMSVRPIEPEPAAPDVPEPTRPAFDVGPLLDRLRAAVGQRWRWAWRALTHRGSMVGGALILTELGRTSRGSVSVGRQVVLGRDVTIRLLPADWGGTDVNTLARSYREAFVAGEIVHPNLVRRLAFSQDRTRRFTIEEPLDGPSLAALAVRNDGNGGDTALASILQAARGLLAAHEQGLAHGDPSAENIRLDSNGNVKLGGLGLGGVSPETRDGPESFALSAARDVQILGQTLEILAGGRNGSVRPASGLVEAVAAKMKAAGTANGYRDLADAVRAIETTLGVTPGGTFVPTPDEDARLLRAVEAFHDIPLAALRAKLILGFVGICLLFVALFVRGGHLASAASLLGLLAMTASLYTLVRAGAEGRSGLFGRLRELVLGGRRADWLMIAAVVVVAVAALGFLGWLVGGIALAIASAIFAIGFLVAFDVPIARDRETPLAEARSLLASMRGRGVGEPALRDFVRRSGGRRWDELFEALFGLDETRRALAVASTENPSRFRLDAWRFPILDWIESRLRDRRESLAREQFERIEEAAAIARKINDMTARRKRKRIAEALIVVGREVRDASLAQLAPPGDAIRVTPRPIPDLIREAVETPEKLLTSTISDDLDRGPNPVVRLLAALVGPRIRFLVGGILLAGFLLWADQVNIISSSEIRDRAQQAINAQDISHLSTVEINLGRALDPSDPLILPHIPFRFTEAIAGYGVGAAGLILIVSAFVAGARIALFAIPGALIAWFGPRFGLPAPISSAIGAGLLVVGMAISRR